jgi:glycosyltransferase involved in cell wall biosynthesis
LKCQISKKNGKYLKCKICHITTVHPQEDVRIFHKECMSLGKRYEVVLLVINGVNKSYNNFNVIGHQVDYQSRLMRFIKAPNAAYKRALEINADVYHFHDPEFLPYALRLIRKGKKVIYDVHENVSEQILTKYWIPRLFRNAISFLFKRYEIYVATRLSFICAATDAISDKFKNVNNNTVTISNYPLDSEIELQISETKKENKVCYIGGLSLIRGVEEIVTAMSYIEDVKLILAGKFSPDSLHARTELLTGWEKVKYTGEVSRKETIEIKRKCLAGIVTFLPVANHICAQPNKIFEYMASGLPIIASNFPLWKEIIEDDNCGICVDPASPEEIAKAVLFLKENPVEARDMGVNGLKLVQEKYNWRQEENKLFAVYESLLGA